MGTKRLFALVVLSVFLLTGCSVSLPLGKETETIEYSDEVTEEKSTNETIETVESTEANSSIETTEEVIVSDSPEKEALLSILWGKLLQEIEMSIPGDDQWTRDGDVEATLKNYDLNTYKYLVTVIYPKEKWKSIIWDWPNYITDVAANYKDAEQYLGYNYAGKHDYMENDEELLARKQESVIQIVGKIKTEEYEDAGKFVDNLYPYYYPYMWGSVLREAGELFETLTEGIYGRMIGKAYMTDFDFNTLTGKYWICLENQTPMQISLTFANRDCKEYSIAVNKEAVLSDSVLENAWIGMVFDLSTKRNAK